MGNSDLLGDHPAHRCADDVSAIDVELVEDGNGVTGHICDRVRGGRLKPDEQPNRPAEKDRKRLVEMVELR